MKAQTSTRPPLDASWSALWLLWSYLTASDPMESRAAFAALDLLSALPGGANTHLGEQGMRWLRSAVRLQASRSALWSAVDGVASQHRIAMIRAASQAAARELDHLKGLLRDGAWRLPCGHTIAGLTPWGTCDQCDIGNEWAADMAALRGDTSRPVKAP